MRTAIQLYTLRSLDEPLTATLERVAETSIEGVEFAGLGDGTPSELSETTSDCGLDVVGAHVSLSDLETEYDRTVARYEELGCPRIVVPSYRSEAFETEWGTEEAADRLSTVAARLESDGFDPHYHTHHYEFTDLGGETAFDRLAREADGLSFEVDTGLTRHAGHDPAAVIERYGERISLVHLTDTDPGSTESRHADLGEGIVDLGACVAAARRVGAAWLVCEHGGSTDPAGTLARFDAELDRLLGRP